MTDSQKILRLYESDQQDRITNNLSPSRDDSRVAQILALRDNGKIVTAEDYYRAAMILHHRGTVSYLEIALQFAEASIELGYTKAKWLYAAVTDRILMEKNLPQKYGTQFRKADTNSPWKLYEYDHTVSDEERAEFDVPPISEQLKTIERLNKTS